MDAIFSAPVKIFITLYNTVATFAEFLFEPYPPLQALAEFSDKLPNWLEEILLGPFFDVVETIGNQPLIVTIFGSTLIVCLAWGIIKFFLPTS